MGNATIFLFIFAVFYILWLVIKDVSDKNTVGNLTATPRNIEDCLEDDTTTKNLWLWANLIKKIGKVVFWCILIFGISSCFESSFSSSFYFNAFIIGILTTMIFAIAEYCFYNVVALLISALANITRNTRRTALLTELDMRQKCQNMQNQESKETISKENS